MQTTIKQICCACWVCKEAKHGPKKCGPLPPKNPEVIPWHTLCVDLIGPHDVGKGDNLVKLHCLTMIDPATGGPHTAHTTYDVPLIVIEPGVEGRELRTGGRLADIAPTLLTLMGLEIPADMTGQSLIEL